MNRKYSLKSNQEIEKLIKGKRSVGNRYYAMYYQPSDQTKIAISPSRKLKTAVQRNYEKRVVREILRKQFTNLQGLKILVIVKNTVSELSFTEKQNQLRYLIKKINKEIK